MIVKELFEALNIKRYHTDSLAAHRILFFGILKILFCSSVDKSKMILMLLFF